MDDRAEIIEIINLYALAIDAQRWDLFDRIFTPDCAVDYGSAARWQGLEVFKQDFAAFHAPFDATQHMMANHQVRIEGDRAWALTYGSWRLVRHAAADLGTGGPLWDGTGWYDDELVRSPQGWRIANRMCKVVWFTGNDTVRETLPGVTFEDPTTSLREEGAAGRLGYLKAIS
jgi:SnoaL-like domain